LANGATHAPLVRNDGVLTVSVVPKKALTGSVQERVDVRVLQLIYRVDAPPEGLTLYCGQQVDVYLDDPTSP